MYGNIRGVLLLNSNETEIEVRIEEMNNLQLEYAIWIVDFP